jgi:hypothetical protein
MFPCPNQRGNMKNRAKILQKFFRYVPCMSNHAIIKDSNLQIQTSRLDDMLADENLELFEPAIPSYIKQKEAKKGNNALAILLHTS